VGGHKLVTREEATRDPHAKIYLLRPAGSCPRKSAQLDAKDVTEEIGAYVIETAQKKKGTLKHAQEQGERTKEAYSST
jgi:hypothetical protein